MKKLLVLFALIVLLGIIYPNINFIKNDKLYLCGYGNGEKDLEELENGTFCYDESYIYNEERNISIKGWELKKFLFLNYYVVDFEKGNKCSDEFLLKESYILDFMENAEINKDESDKVDLKKLIKDKTAIEGNTKYEWNDDYKYVLYKLNGEEKEMFIYNTSDGLLVIQVGNRDEGPKFIAYK